jgi:hypothetical protein
MPDNFIRDYWPQLTFAALTLIGFGKGWQLFNIMCTTLKEHGAKMVAFRSFAIMFAPMLNVKNIGIHVLPEMTNSLQKLKAC